MGQLRTLTRSLIGGRVILEEESVTAWVEITSNCPNCTDTEETVAHYISQCPAYSRIRGDTLGTYYDSINNIMDNNNIDLIINFALKTKRLLKKEEKDDTGVT